MPTNTTGDTPEMKTSRPNALYRNTTMFDSVFAMMSSQVQGLSGEVADVSDSHVMGSCAPQPQLSVLGSTNPTPDSATILWLFPHKYSQTTSSGALLLQEKENPSTGTTIMLIHCGVDGPLQWKNAILILDELEISCAVNRCKNRPASVLRQERIEVSRHLFTTFAVIRLTGGSNLVLLTIALVQSHVGRAALADFVASRDLIEANESRGKFSLQEESWLNEIEEEFSLRRSPKATDKDYGVSSVPHGPTMSPTLKVSLQRRHGFLQNDIPTNSKSPLTFETDLFVGKMVLLMKSSESEDGLHDICSNDTNARFVLQIQGKFKYVPTGTLFAGAELTCDTLQPALVTKGLCGLLLKAIKRKHPETHSSYGNGVEKPHIVVPAWTFFDRIVRTKPTDVPPSINETFIEPAGSVSARQNSGSKGAWNTMDTYSFGYFCSFVDFPSWQLVNVPYCQETSLHNFLGNSKVRLVLYEHRINLDSTEQEEQEVHKPAANSYLISLLLEHVMPEVDSPPEIGEQVEKWERVEALSFGNSRSTKMRDSTDTGICANIVPIYSDDEMSMEGDVMVTYVDGDQALTNPVFDALPSQHLMDVVNSWCPAWFDVIENDRRYSKVYAFRNAKKSSTFLRTLPEFQVHLDTVDAVKYVNSVSSPRISDSEKARRVLGYTYFNGQSKHTAKIRQLHTAGNESESTFLRRTEPVFDQTKSKQNVIKSGYIARAISDHHWREEYVLLLGHHVAFFHPDNLKPHFRINLKSVIKGKKLPPEEAPDMPGYFFLELDTIGRRIYLMFVSQESREEWTTAMNVLILNYRMTGATSNWLDGIDNPTEQFMHKSSMWACDHRLLLNCRLFSFRPSETAYDPIELVEISLLLAVEALETGNENIMINFLDTTSQLKNINIYQLQGNDRLAFLLNLYHLMVMHSYLLLGPPDSSSSYVDMIQKVSYQVSDDIFSLAELELNIIRGNMSYPVEFAPRFVLPKSKYGFALANMDLRVNFALICGSRSTPQTVPIYKATIIEMQLDAAAILYLEDVKVESNQRAIFVSLPRLFLWYAQDFGSSFDMMVKIAPHLNEHNQGQLKMVSYNTRIFIKHAPFDFQCRQLEIDDTRARNIDPLESTSYVSERDGGLVMEPDVN